jgi:hypothetical protein
VKDRITFKRNETTETTGQEETREGNEREERRELALADAVTDPVKTHVDGFRALLLDGVIGNTDCGCG